MDYIFGQDKTENIVSIDVKNDELYIFTEKEGKIDVNKKEMFYWLLSNKSMGNATFRLDGDNFFKYARTFDDINEYRKHRNLMYEMRSEIYSPGNLKEMAMIAEGYTYFKNSKVEDISILSFDIETTGLLHNSTSKVIAISNTFRKLGNTTKKLFYCTDYENPADMFIEWCEFVRKCDPSVLTGHNILIYDLPYMNFCAKRLGVELDIGRDGSGLQFAKRPSLFRKDGSQSYDYTDIQVFGREIVDTFFLSIKSDIERKYESYGLKQIIKQEGLEKKNRTFYPADKIKDNYLIPEEAEKIKAYCVDDSDDSLALYDLMIPSYFYYANYIPKSFQQIINTATGSQLNSFLVRAYLQEEHSIPKSDDVSEYGGGISFGIPGIYKNCLKLDVASMYPSIILEHKLYNKEKDPKGYFLKMVEYFTEERLKNKELAKTTKLRLYDDKQKSNKTFINSAYGLCGTNGLHFNSPDIASFITSTGRDILTMSIEWASGKKLNDILNVVNDSEEKEDEENDNE